MSVRVFIGLGSNLNKPLKQLQQAVAAISKLGKTQIQKVSSVYLSEAMGPQDQADYLNAVIEIQTTLAAHELLRSLQAIEAQQGRVRDGSRWTARPLDLDILLYGDDCIDTTDLVVPHPGLHERAFVLCPLQELDEELGIPMKGQISSLMQQKLDGAVIKKLDSALCP